MPGGVSPLAPVSLPSLLTIVGQDVSHLAPAGDGEAPRVHLDVAAPLAALVADARDAGFDLRVLSGFRSFERQLGIWNRKATGAADVLDSDSRPLDIRRFSPRELVFAILRWSALPGASRHHWGTDLDVYDAAAMPAGYDIQLVPAEVEHGGMFAPLHEWLDRRIAAGRSHGFYRPYDRDRGGVAPERWHLSHAPVALGFLRQLTPALLREAIASADMQLKAEVLDAIDEIHARYVVNVAEMPSAVVVA